MERPIFVTGIGTGVGKTLVSAVLASAWGAAYWKPIQAGYEDGTDRQWVAAHTDETVSTIFPEQYVLRMPASPHIAAKAESLEITVAALVKAKPETAQPLLIEGAGGLLVPLNDRETMADLAATMKARIVLVSRNYLGSINHSLLTAAYCSQNGLDVLGWVFNDRFGNYEEEIAARTGYPIIASILPATTVDVAFVREQAKLVPPLKTFL
ncbi:dethiobiotin synthase [Flavihumibacter petaseus]|uniref:ATP-dependent dethiobiotin synthetase BioD n=1 Tax=Flavihumibacter petaseus NBRC 106054 TaxID=1220578 RepID=A0A0E9N4H9_9BACT|nr:dethiobiotin synthase [Flavihumibacter petaseus]GAO44576.1 ATP-dependent dethiobiotin synthetase BioD [Flavihumibacter petaseus NBRC 106054]